MDPNFTDIGPRETKGKSTHVGSCSGLSIVWRHLLPEQMMVKFIDAYAGQILGLRSANERRRYKLTPSLIGWAQT